MALCEASADTFTRLAGELDAARQKPKADLWPAADVAKKCAEAEAALWKRALELFAP